MRPCFNRANLKALNHENAYFIYLSGIIFRALNTLRKLENFKRANLNTHHSVETLNIKIYLVLKKSKYCEQFLF